MTAVSPLKTQRETEADNLRDQAKASMDLESMVETGRPLSR